MKRTNCPKFFVRTKVDNSGSCENISTRNKIYCHDFPENAYKCSTFCKSSLWRQKAFLVVMFMCFICLWFPARGGHSNASDTEQSGQSGSGHLICISLIQYSVPTGCPKKNALLSLKAYNSGLEAAIGTSRDSFGILRLWAFIWDQEVQDYVMASLRKSYLKLATLSQKKCQNLAKTCAE